MLFPWHWVIFLIAVSLGLFLLWLLSGYYMSRRPFRREWQCIRSHGGGRLTTPGQMSEQEAIEWLGRGNNGEVLKDRSGNKGREIQAPQGNEPSGMPRDEDREAAASMESGAGVLETSGPESVIVTETQPAGETPPATRTEQDGADKKTYLNMATGEVRSAEELAQEGQADSGEYVSWKISTYSKRSSRKTLWDGAI